MFAKGSEWRQWDLHIHTPASYEWRNEKFNGDKEHDDKLIDEMIRHLNDAEPAVFALMDYFTFDGWFKLQKRLNETGAPKLYKKVFPGIELRICAPKIRLNVHAIFSDKVRDQDLKDFLAEQEIEENNKRLSPDNLIHYIRHTGTDLLSKHHIDPSRLEHDDAYALEKACSLASLKRENFISSIEKFDDCIAFMPWDTYNGLSEINLLEHYTFVMSLFKSSTIMESRNKDYRDLFLLKKTSKNQKFFDVFQKAVDYTPRLVVAGSDAHSFKDYGIYPSGKKTWIKADPTFEGLKQAIKEPENRSYIGDMPEKLQEKLGKGSYFIDCISINKKEESDLADQWLDKINLSLNHDLVAIIGKKGSGKSALADVISLLGNSKSGGDHFSFLKDGRFKGKSGYAKDFNATLKWLNTSTCTKNLNDSINHEDIERVRYIPQEYFEKLCNSNKREFQNELNKVIYSYLDMSEKGNSTNLDELIIKKEEFLKKQLGDLNIKLNTINKEISNLEKKSQQKFKNLLESKKSAKEQEVKDHLDSKPTEVLKPNEVLTVEQIEINKNIDLKEIEKNELTISSREEMEINDSLSLKIKKIDNIYKHLESLINFLDNIKKDIKEDVSDLDLKFENFMNFDFNLKFLEDKKGEFIQDKNDSIGKINEINVRTSTLDTELSQLKTNLTKPNQEYQNYIDSLHLWNSKNEKLIGSATELDTLLGLEKQLQELNLIPQELLNKKEERKELAEKIYDVFEEKKKIRDSLYIPVQEFIEKNNFINQRNKFEFLSKLEFSFDKFQQKLVHLIKQQRSDFTPDNIQNTLTKLSSDLDLESKNGVIQFITNMSDKLEEVNGEIGIDDMIRIHIDPVEVYDFLFQLDFIKPLYSLKFQETEVEKLSPGQRGALLLIFYLLIDKEKTPIILDQPEENLDNDTVVNSLVPIITEAKKTRQIIMVTHNPNLAVVCDAEQIIYANFNRSKNLMIEYKSGSIESSEINQHAVNILEGTISAFNNRKNKYFS